MFGFKWKKTCMTNLTFSSHILIADKPQIYWNNIYPCGIFSYHLSAVCLETFISGWCQKVFRLYYLLGCVLSLQNHLNSKKFCKLNVEINSNQRFAHSQIRSAEFLFSCARLISTLSEHFLIFLNQRTLKFLNLKWLIQRQEITAFDQ